MNISPYFAKSCPDFLFANFNQDSGCFVAGTKTGFKIFNSDPLRQTEAEMLSPTEQEEGGGVKLAEMLFRCNYVALVCPARPTEVKIWDDAKKRFVITLDAASDVKAIKLRRDRIVLVLENIIKVYTFTQAPQQLHVFDTGANPSGICSLSPSSENSLLAFPDKVAGRVQVINLADTDKPALNIPAHESVINCLTLNIQGTRLATASEKGTLIRVFETTKGQKVSELRRGTNRATIHSISFSNDSSLLCACSSNGTIHVFAVEESSQNHRSSLASPSGFLAANNLLPKYLASEWSFAKIDIPGGTPCICAFGSTNNSIIAVCADGSYHKFLFDKKEGTHTRDVYQMFLDLEESGSE